MKIRQIAFLIFFILIACLYILKPTIDNPLLILYLVAPIGGTIIGLIASKFYGFKNPRGKALLLITGGLACYSVAEIIWTVSIITATEQVQSTTSMADIFFLSAYPFFFAGIYQSYKAAEIKVKKIKKSLLIKVVPLSLALMGLVLYFGVYKTYNPTLDPLTNTLNVSYGLIDLFLVISSLLTILVSNEYKGGKLASFWNIITVGFLFTLVADIASSIYADQYLDGVKPYTYIDLIWTAAYLLMAYAILEDYMHGLQVRNKIKLMLTQRKQEVGV